MLATGTCDVVGCDPGRAEGITGFKKIADRVEAYRRQANAHAWSSAIVTAASLAVSFSSPAFKLFEVKPLRNPMQHDLVTEPFEHGRRIRPARRRSARASASRSSRRSSTAIESGRGERPLHEALIGAIV